MSATDPFFVVRDEVQKSISHLESLFESWQKLETNRRSNAAFNADQLKWTADEIRNSVKTIEWDIQDLEETIRIVEANPQKFKLDSGEVGRRKLFVTDAKSKIERILKSVNDASVKSEMQKKQREQLLGDPLTNAAAATASSQSNAKAYRDHSKMDSVDDDLVQNENRQQMMIMNQQDEQMDHVYSTVVNLKNIAVTMGDELDDQQILLEELDTKVDSAGNRLKNAMNRVSKIIISDKGYLLIFFYTPNDIRLISV